MILLRIFSTPVNGAFSFFERPVVAKRQQKLIWWWRFEDSGFSHTATKIFVQLCPRLRILFFVFLVAGVCLALERFSNECRKTKTKVITNQSRQEQKTKWTNQKLKQIQLSSVKHGKTRASKSQLFFFFTSDWIRKWRELFQPVRERSKAKPRQTQHYFRNSFENCSIMPACRVLTFRWCWRFSCFEVIQL